MCLLVARRRRLPEPQTDGAEVRLSAKPPSYEGERPALPMIDVTLSKENALPFDLWGLIYKGWQPAPEEGVLRRQASCSVPVKCEPQRSLSTCWTCST